MKPNDIAVIVRNSFSAALLEVELTKAHQDYIFRGGRKFLESSYAQDVLQFLEVINGTNVNISWQRTLTLFEGIGPKKAQEIITKLTTVDSKIDIDLINENTFKPSLKYWSSLQKFKALFAEAKTKKTVAEMVSFIINYYTTVKEEQLKEKNGNNLSEELDKLDQKKAKLELLGLVAEEYTSLRDFLDDLVLDEEINEDKSTDGTLILSTIHSAKGLEWKTVIFMDVLDTSLPGRYQYASTHPLAIELTKITYEEGRRLCYVACTRAKDYLFILYPRVAKDGSPLRLSPFINNQRVLSTMTYITEWELKDLIRH